MTEQLVETIHSVHDAAVAGAAEKRSEAKVLSSQAQVLQEIADASASVADSIQSNRPGRVRYVVEQLRHKLDGRCDKFPSALDQASSEARVQLETIRGSIIDEISLAFQSADFTQQIGRTYPEFGLDAGFYSIRFDEETWIVNVMTRDGKKSGVPVPWDALDVLAALRDARARCFPKTMPTTKIKKLVARLAREAHQGRVTVAALFEAVKSAKIVESRDEFAAALAATANNGLIHLEFARDSRDGILLPSYETRGRVGYVSVAAS